MTNNNIFQNQKNPIITFTEYIEKIEKMLEKNRKIKERIVIESRILKMRRSNLRTSKSLTVIKKKNYRSPRKQANSICK